MAHKAKDVMTTCAVSYSPLGDICRIVVIITLRDSAVECDGHSALAAGAGAPPNG